MVPQTCVQGQARRAGLNAAAGAVRFDVPPNRTRPRRLAVRRSAVIGTAVVLLLAVAGYLIYHSFQQVSPPVALAPGCQAGTGPQAVSLDLDQAGIAATIAGVAARHKLPRQAVTIAYAVALQESQLQNLDYGDRDSVGVFQQRPSQGWGTTSEIENPVYATTRFFAALVDVRDYTRMPVADRGAGRAAQRGRSCLRPVDGRGGAAGRLLHRQLTARGVLLVPGAARGESGRRGAGTYPDVWTAGAASDCGECHHGSFRLRQDGSVAVVPGERGSAWTVADWLVANAQTYGISEVRYAGYEWNAADGEYGLAA